MKFKKQIPATSVNSLKNTLKKCLEILKSIHFLKRFYKALDALIFIGSILLLKELDANATIYEMLSRVYNNFMKQVFNLPISRIG